MILKKYKADPKDPAPHKSLHVECPDCRGSCCDDYYLLTREELEAAMSEAWEEARAKKKDSDGWCRDKHHNFKDWLNYTWLIDQEVKGG